MKKVLIFSLMLCVVFGMVFAAAGSEQGGAKKFNLRYAHVGIAGEIQTNYVDELAKLVNQRTNGAVTIQVFPNSQLGGANEMVDGIRSGAISMGHHEF